MGLDQKRLELRPAPGVAADGQGAERIAMIALPPGDDMTALRLADLDKILARHLERRRDRLRAAAHEMDVGQARASPIAPKYWRPILGAASTASEPPLTR